MVSPSKAEYFGPILTEGHKELVLLSENPTIKGTTELDLII